jgi:hypothetical protein
MYSNRVLKNAARVIASLSPSVLGGDEQVSGVFSGICSVAKFILGGGFPPGTEPALAKCAGSLLFFYPARLRSPGPSMVSAGIE